MKIKIRIKDKEHSKKVQEYLFALGYKWEYLTEFYIITEMKYIVVINNHMSYGNCETYFNNYKLQEVELVTEVSDGKVCTYIKEVEPSLKKWKFEVRTNVFGDLVLGAVDVDSGELIAKLINLNTMDICGYAKNILKKKYDISGYEWNDDGSIKIN